MLPYAALVLLFSQRYVHSASLYMPVCKAVLINISTVLSNTVQYSLNIIYHHLNAWHSALLPGSGPSVGFRLLPPKVVRCSAYSTYGLLLPAAVPFVSAPLVHTQWHYSTLPRRRNP